MKIKEYQQTFDKHPLIALMSSRPSIHSSSEGPLGGEDGRMYGCTDVRTYVQIPPVFYRTSSPPVPSGAAAQKEGVEREREGVERKREGVEREREGVERE